VLGRSAGGSERRRAGGQTEVGEDGIDGLGGGDEGEDAHVAAAAGAGEGEDLVDAGEEAGPAGAGGGAVRGVRQVGGADAGGSCCGSRNGTAVGVARRHDSVAAEGDYPLAQARVRCEDAVVAVAMDAGRRDQAAQCGEQPKRSEGRRRQLEGGEGEDGAAVTGGSRGQVEDLADAGIAI
jgi:hypothetical protein